MGIGIQHRRRQPEPFCQRGQSSREAAYSKLPALFAIAGLLLLGAIVWLGWRLIEQDRALEDQRIRERLESASSLVIRELNRTFTEWEELLRAAVSGGAVTPPAGGAVVVFGKDAIERRYGTSLPFYPFALKAREASPELFAGAETAEFREQDYVKACGMYRALSQTADRLVRAAALMRLARCLRKQRRLAQAAAAYQELAALGDTPVAGSPAELLARRERLALFHAAGGGDAAAREASLLASALRSGRFTIDRTTYDFYRDSLPPEALPGENNYAIALAEALERIWEQSPKARGRSMRIALAAHGVTVAAVGMATEQGTAALVSGLDSILARLHDSVRQLGVRVELADDQNRPAWGGPLSATSLRVARTSAETGLPWTVRATSADDAGERAAAASRRRLLVSVLALLVLAVLAAGYAIFRAVSREVSVARLQSDFVAAVSHEFRTPLAAMCHLTESLEENRVSEDRRPAYYQALAKESRRLRVLVENLLDFARMESGRQVLRKEKLEAVDLVRGVVADFYEQVRANGRRIDVEVAAGEPCVMGDREAVSRAVRNLLDNAFKYSPDSSPIRVSVREQGQDLAIAVEDEGPGIAPAEQADVFRKFVRGSSSRELNVKGTGIGLAMVRHIVEAHGGHVLLESEPGRGSRFTITLPLEAKQG